MINQDIQLSAESAANLHVLTTTDVESGYLLAWDGKNFSQVGYLGRLLRWLHDQFINTVTAFDNCKSVPVAKAIEEFIKKNQTGNNDKNIIIKKLEYIQNKIGYQELLASGRNNSTIQSKKFFIGTIICNLSKSAESPLKDNSELTVFEKPKSGEFNCIPDELIREIFSFMTTRDTALISRTSKQFINNVPVNCELAFKQVKNLRRRLQSLQMELPRDGLPEIVTIEILLDNKGRLILQNGDHSDVVPLFSPSWTRSKWANIVQVSGEKQDIIPFYSEKMQKKAKKNDTSILKIHRCSIELKPQKSWMDDEGRINEGSLKEKPFRLRNSDQLSDEHRKFVQVTINMLNEQAEEDNQIVDRRGYKYMMSCLYTKNNDLIYDIPGWLIILTNRGGNRFENGHPSYDHNLHTYLFKKK